MSKYLMMKELPEFQQPREKLLKWGAHLLSTEEILAILLRTGYKGKNVLDLANETLETIKGEEGLFSLSPKDLTSIKGIGVDKAVTICAAIELGRRLQEVKAKRTYADFSDPKAVAAYVMERLRHQKEEHFQVAFLNTKNKLIKIEELSIGGLSSSLAEQRTLFRKAIEANAASIILIHNHPSGDPTPSSEDIRVTEIFMEASILMGIPILDHIIIGDGRFVSLCGDGHITFSY